VKVFRFLFLLIVITAAYSGQYIFEYLSLADLFPQPLLERYPILSSFAYWLPADLLNLAFWMSALACIGFGMLVSPWAGDLALEVPSTISWWRSLPPIRLQVAAITLLLASISAACTTWWLYQDNPETLAIQALWLLAILLYCFSCWLITGRPTSATVLENDDYPKTSPLRSWPLLLLILAGAGILLGRELLDLPVRVTRQVAQIGLQANEIYLSISQITTFARSLAPSTSEFLTHELFTIQLFSAGDTGLPQLAYLMTASAIGLSDDMFLGTRIIGLFMGLMTPLATWLVGTELFRRTPLLGKYGEIIEDDGRWPALLAALIVTICSCTIHFSRLPLYQEPVVSGLLSLWALLYGLRTGRIWLVALSGLLCGWSMILLPSGLLFLPLVPLWWVGIVLLQRRWLYIRYGGIGGIGLAIWLSGLGFMLAPLIGRWWRHPNEWWGYLRTESLIDVLPTMPLNSYWFDTLWQTLLAFNFHPDTSILFGYAYPLLDYRLAPLFVLAFGAILLNLDRLPGWFLLTWLGSGIFFSSLLNGQAPFWPTLLPLIPAIGFAIAFAADRIHLLLSETIGTWVGQLGLYLVLGLALWSGLSNWLNYYEFSHLRADTYSYIGRAAREVSSDRTLILINDPARNQRDGLPPMLSWEEPVLAFLSNRPAVGNNTLSLTTSEWRASLPAQSRLLIQGADVELADEVKLRYPGGRLFPLRNNRSGPVLYIYDMP